jgi:hypothetical protein
MRTTRTVPHPRWPGRKITPRARRVSRDQARLVAELGLVSSRLQAGLADLRGSFQALKAEQRRANILAIMEGAEPCYAQREAFVRQAVARHAGGCSQG